MNRLYTLYRQMVALIVLAVLATLTAANDRTAEIVSCSG